MFTATTKQKVLSNRAYMFHWFEYVYFIQGLALINGTQFITSLGVEALERAANVTDAANAIAAMSLEVLKGTTRAFDEGKCYTSLYIPVLITSLRKHLLNTIWSKNAVLDSQLCLYRTKDAQRDWVTKPLSYQLSDLVYETHWFISLNLFNIMSGRDSYQIRNGFFL